MLCIVCTDEIEDARARGGATKCAQCAGKQPQEGSMTDVPVTAPPDLSEKTPRYTDPYFEPTAVEGRAVEELHPPSANPHEALLDALAQASADLSKLALEVRAISDYATSL